MAFSGTFSSLCLMLSVSAEARLTLESAASFPELLAGGVNLQILLYKYQLVEFSQQVTLHARPHCQPEVLTSVTSVSFPNPTVHRGSGIRNSPVPLLQRP